VVPDIASVAPDVDGLNSFGVLTEPEAWFGGAQTA